MVEARTGTVTQAYPQGNLSMILVTIPEASDAADTVTIDLSTYGIGVFIGAIAFEHTTTGSVVVAGSTSQPTTAVSGTTLTLTLAMAGTNNVQAILVWGLASEDTNLTAP